MPDKSSTKPAVVELPAYVAERQSVWDRCFAERRDWEASQPRQPIKIRLPDGRVEEGMTWETTPFEVAARISQGLAEASVVARVNGQLWDLDRPLEHDVDLQLVKFDDPDGQYVFWHSSAHILGEAMEREYKGCLCYGPPVEEGFYYDMFMEDRQVTPDDFKGLDSSCKQIVKEKQAFERLVMKKADLLEMFKYNVFKHRLIQERVKEDSTTVYRCGPLIDLCRGPHVRHTGKIKAMQVTKNGAALWEGKADAEQLQRIYGISFPDAKQLKEWQHFQAEAAKRDHRRIGVQQKLFFFHELSPGSCFFMPRGAHIYNKLVSFIRELYWERGFQEVITPNLYNSKLWEQSGHWQHYADNMFQIDIEKQKFGLKPMNCPGHCLMFAHELRSYRELPLRMADFGVLHRNEISGALSGLTRVRRFQQDDAHIFCRPDQIGTEIAGCLDFLQHVYGVFGFTFELFLSTRPEGYLGALSLWNKAEAELTASLNASGLPWKLNPGDGAFYGPKIDITIQDALRRNHQCATIQLDFQLPERFDLTFHTEDVRAAAPAAVSEEEQLATGVADVAVADGQPPAAAAAVVAKGFSRPVIIHRAILGSVERMIAILTESCAGKWPFWLSPMQCVVIPVVANSCDAYALEVKSALHAAGFRCDVELDPSKTLNKKVRNAQLAQYNFILVVGEKERANNTVNVRTRDNKVHGEHAVQHVVARFTELQQSRCRDAEEIF